jgi:hypothetical protein
MKMLVQGCQSRGLKRRLLLRTSSPLKPRIIGNSHWDWYSKPGHFIATHDKKRSRQIQESI